MSLYYKNIQHIASLLLEEKRYLEPGEDYKEEPGLDLDQYMSLPGDERHDYSKGDLPQDKIDRALSGGTYKLPREKGINDDFDLDDYDFLSKDRKEDANHMLNMASHLLKHGHFPPKSKEAGYAFNAIDSLDDWETQFTMYRDAPKDLRAMQQFANKDKDKELDDFAAGDWEPEEEPKMPSSSWDPSEDLASDFNAAKIDDPFPDSHVSLLSPDRQAQMKAAALTLGHIGRTGKLPETPFHPGLKHVHDDKMLSLEGAQQYLSDTFPRYLRHDQQMDNAKAEAVKRSKR